MTEFAERNVTQNPKIENTNPKIKLETEELQALTKTKRTKMGIRELHPYIKNELSK